MVRVDGHGELSAGYLATVARLLESTGAANVGGLMDARRFGSVLIGIAVFQTLAIFAALRVGKAD